MPTSLPQRKRLRYEGYDYHTAGAYFVTLCVEDRLSLLGQPAHDSIILTDAGMMVTEVWNALPGTFPSVKLDAFVVMPNHLHFIVWITTPLLAAPVVPMDGPPQGAAPTGRVDGTSQGSAPVVGADPRVCPDVADTHAGPDTHERPSLPDVLRWFKSLTTAHYRHGVHAQNWPKFAGKLWQRSYYEHVIRSEAALYAIRRYIQSNPQRWHMDRYHPNPSGHDEEAVALWRLLQSEHPL